MTTAHQTPTKVLSDYIDYTVQIEEDQRRHIDDLYARLLASEPDVLKAVLTGKRKSAVVGLIDTDISELNPDDIDREDLTPAVKTVVDKVVELINAIDAANKVPGAPGLTQTQVDLTEYVADHSAEIDTIQIQGLPFGKYLHGIAGTDECNNILASAVRPRLMAISAGKPMALLVQEKLKKAKVIH